MTATAHTEIYRPFRGTLQPQRFRFRALHRARVAAAQKSKLALLILFAPPAISGIVFSFVVYMKFTLESAEAPAGFNPAASLAISMAERMIDVHRQIVFFALASRNFALLAIAWYGAGLICEDRRHGAHLLLFSRPLTRLDYFLAQLATACTFGLRAVLAPSLLICVVAVFSSPDYSFLREKWNVILATIAYGFLFVGVVSLIALAISSVSSRKMYARAGVFAVFFGTGAVGAVLQELDRSREWRLISLYECFERVLEWMLDAQSVFRRGIEATGTPWSAIAVLAGVSAASLALIAWRLRRMEVVA
jgi:ABC-type transport system involved in multi-copper enzyme maturation permease subunit